MPRVDRANAQFMVGRLLCAHVRDFLAAERLKGRNIQWHESSGLTRRMFTVSGDAKDVIYVHNTLVAWAQQ